MAFSLIFTEEAKANLEELERDRGLVSVIGVVLGFWYFPMKKAARVSGDPEPWQGARRGFGAQRVDGGLIGRSP